MAMVEPVGRLSRRWTGFGSGVGSHGLRSPSALGRVGGRTGAGGLDQRCGGRSAGFCFRLVIGGGCGGPCVTADHALMWVPGSAIPLNHFPVAHHGVGKIIASGAAGRPWDSHSRLIRRWSGFSADHASLLITFSMWVPGSAIPLNHFPVAHHEIWRIGRGEVLPVDPGRRMGSHSMCRWIRGMVGPMGHC